MKAQARRQTETGVRRWPRLRPWTGVVMFGLIFAAALVFGTRAMLAQTGLAQVQVSAPFAQVNEAAVADVLRPWQGERIMGLDLSQLEDELSSMPWVDKVRLRRVWPDGIHVALEEHQAVARWGETGLVNERGELFEASAPASLVDLPVFNGPPERSAEMLAVWRELHPRLASHELMASQLLLDRRGSWRMVLAQGVEVRLGTADPLVQAERFLRHGWPEIADRVMRVRYVDLRYTNGFAVAERERDAEGG